MILLKDLNVGVPRDVAMVPYHHAVHLEYGLLHLHEVRHSESHSKNAINHCRKYTGTPHM